MNNYGGTPRDRFDPRRFEMQTREAMSQRIEDATMPYTAPCCRAEGASRSRCDEDMSRSRRGEDMSRSRCGENTERSRCGEDMSRSRCSENTERSRCGDNDMSRSRCGENTERSRCGEDMSRSRCGEDMPRSRCGENMSRSCRREDSDCGRGEDCMSDFSLAMVYSPHQHWRNLYDEETGLTRGTIFEELDKPFHGPACMGGGCNG